MIVRDQRRVEQPCRACNQPIMQFWDVFDFHRAHYNAQGHWLLDHVTMPGHVIANLSKRRLDATALGEVTNLGKHHCWYEDLAATLLGEFKGDTSLIPQAAMLQSQHNGDCVGDKITRRGRAAHNPGIPAPGVVSPLGSRHLVQRLRSSVAWRRGDARSTQSLQLLLTPPPVAQEYPSELAHDRLAQTSLTILQHQNRDLTQYA